MEQDALAVREQLFHERVRECIVSARGEKGSGVAGRGARSPPWGRGDRSGFGWGRAAPHPALIGAGAAAAACGPQIAGTRG